MVKHSFSPASVVWQVVVASLQDKDHSVLLDFCQCNRVSQDVLCIPWNIASLYKISTPPPPPPPPRIFVILLTLSISQPILDLFLSCILTSQSIICSVCTCGNAPSPWGVIKRVYMGIPLQSFQVSVAPPHPISCTTFSSTESSSPSPPYIMYHF